MTTRGFPDWPWADTPADDLPQAERLLLDAARLWAAARRRGAHPGLALRPPFLAEDAPAAATPCMVLLHRAIPDTVGLGCSLCPRVTPVEARLLLGCAQTQRGARREALAGFMGWLPPAAAMAAMPPAIALGAALRAVGLLLNDPFRVRAAPRRAGPG